MTVIHYLHGTRPACGRRLIRATDNMDTVECKHCLKRIPAIEEARREAMRLEQVALDVEAAGLTWLYDRLLSTGPTDSASLRMLREMVGALAKYVIETREDVAA